jgi:PAS domain S-box-containing protein
VSELALGALFAGLVWVTHRLDQRRESPPGAFWKVGWLLWFGTGILLALAGDSAWTPNATLLLGPFFPVLMLAGALRHGGRAVPRWLVPAALMLGLLRCGLHLAGFPALEPVVALLFEPTALIAAAWLAFRAVQRNAHSRSERLLAPSLLALAAVEATGSVAAMNGRGIDNGHLLSWALVGTFAILVQLRIARETALHRERRVAQALSASEERDHALTENSFDLITEIDPKGRFLYLNGRCEEWFGYPRGELVGKDAVEFVHPDDRERTRDWFRRLRESGEGELLTVRLPRRRGDCRWLEISGRTFQHGGELHFAANSRDVTERFELSAELERANEELESRVERRNAQLHAAVAGLEAEIAERSRVEDELRVSEERWRNVSELSSDMSFATTRTADGALHADWITNAVSRMTGHEMADLQRSGYASLVHPDDVEMVTDNLQQIQTGETRDYVVRGTTPIGDRRWLRTRIIGKPSDIPGAVKILGAARDITEAREAAEAQRRLDAHLQESQKFESLGVLAGGVAHDFNNALAVILGNAALALADAKAGSRTQLQLERIRSAGRHAEALTRQMLTYSGKATVSLKPLDLRRLIDDMSELLEAAVPDTCRIHFAEAPGITRIEGDPTQIQQIVMNLVTNAAEAVGAEPSRITVRTGAMIADAEALDDTYGSSDLEPGWYVFLEVSDPGGGIDEETRSRIFEPFFSTKFTGRGLGLASVLGIVRGHKGAIKLTTEPGTGTRFRVLFPASSEVERSAPTRSERAPGSAAAARVLVVDDDDAVVEVASAFLSRSGFDVVTAGSGHEALEILGSDQPETIRSVVLDLSMPELDGLETLDRIRRLRPTVPVVIVSGYAEEVTDARFASHEISAFVRKPFEPDELVAAVRAGFDA